MNNANDRSALTDKRYLGAFPQGHTRGEVLKNIQEAIEGYLERLKVHDEPISPSIDAEVVEVIV
ncbi:type II toxin-antitoxin system HicB family antitoxin [Nitrococcus mobilis]|uniref:HicB-like antitoxin of toxin-antitoxin system domain-containing protein n=1 Tax=Nitrococcus mobilis Nb-231 TaxID=314278 RepID=A4BQW1_9GAMM|nr:type II toxin-antitoxin system HicB family antitoxin [Nitrococcus mobilis]EAR21961.1 hypothetical protein NB231_06221 [Nitrococcus mobilis Nb-231]